MPNLKVPGIVTKDLIKRQKIAEMRGSRISLESELLEKNLNNNDYIRVSVSLNIVFSIISNLEQLDEEFFDQSSDLKIDFDSIFYFLDEDLFAILDEEEILSSFEKTLKNRNYINISVNRDSKEFIFKLNERR